MQCLGSEARHAIAVKSAIGRVEDAISKGAGRVKGKKEGEGEDSLDDEGCSPCQAQDGTRSSGEEKKQWSKMQITMPSRLRAVRPTKRLEACCFAILCSSLVCLGNTHG